MTLAWIGQEDFAAGMLRSSARGTEPGVGVTLARNGLFDDDGDVYRRGGDAFALDNIGDALTFTWSGFLEAGPSTLVTTATNMLRGTPTGLEYIVDPFGLPGPVQVAVINGQLWMPNGRSWTGETWTRPWDVPVALTHIGHVAAIANRLVAAAGSRIAFSIPLAEGDDIATFDPTDYHDLPDGVIVMGMVAARDTLLVFSNYGLWSISNMAYDLTDDFGNPQQTMSRLVPEISLLSEGGLCEWSGKVIAPCADRVLMVDPINNPVAVSDSVAPYYMEQVRSGNRPGGAKVFRNHLFLPMLTPAGVVSELFVCRLNRPVRGRSIYYPWSTFDGHAGQVVSLDVNLLESAPRLIGAHPDGQLCDLTSVFNPSEANATDADGTTHSFELQTRDFVTGNGQPNHVKRLRLAYTMIGTGDVEAAYSTGVRWQSYEALIASGATYADADTTFASYEEFFRGGPTSAVTTEDQPLLWWQGLASEAFESRGVDPANWDFPTAERARFIRAWFRCDDPVSKLVVHRVEFGVRPSAHQR